MPGLPARCNQEFIEIDRGGLSCGRGSEVCRPCNLSLSRPDTADCKITFLILIKLAQQLKIGAEKSVSIHQLADYIIIITFIEVMIL